MSLPYSLATCSACGTAFGLEDLEGIYKYEVGRTRIQIDTLSGWCHDCDAHRPIESLDPAPVIARMREVELLLSAKPGFIESHSSTYKERVRNLHYELHDLGQLLAHFKERIAGSKCLDCGSDNVEPCKIGKMKCYRPDCDGHLVEDDNDPIWISYVYDTKLYDMDGCLVSQEEW